MLQIALVTTNKSCLTKEFVDDSYGPIVTMDILPVIKLAVTIRIILRLHYFIINN